MKSIITISGKGGVGKTLTSCLLSQELAKKHGSTGLADMDVDSSNVSKIMNVKMDMVQLTEDRKIIPIIIDNLKINSLSAMLSDSAIAQTGNYYRRVVKDILQNTAWGPDLDYLICDMPPSSSDIFRKTVDIMKANNTLLGAVIVEQPSETEDCKRIFEICKRLFIPIIGFIENMAGCEMHGKTVLCPCGCGEEFSPFGKDDIKEYSKEIHGDFVGKIPLSYELANSRPPQINDGVIGAQTISRLAKKISLAGMPKIPEDKIRQEAGTFKFVGRVMRAFFELIKRANSELNVADLRAKYGRKNPGYVEITVTDCPVTLSEFKVVYVGIGGSKLKMYKKKNFSESATVLGGIKVGSGPLACIIKGEVPVMDPFTHRRYNEEYTFTKAVNCGDIELFGDNAFTEFILLDQLLFHATEVTGMSEEELRRKAEGIM